MIISLGPIRSINGFYYPPYSTQGRLRCTKGESHCRFILKKEISLFLSLREERVNAHMPLWIAPYFLLPAMTPNWASAANARNFIDVPFDGFLAPPSEIADLTRILRHS
jgi:hypothetical protein